MDAWRPAAQQLGGAAQAPFLHLLRAEGGDADLGHPDRQDVTAWMAAILSGHSSMIQLFQSSGKPCTATASSCSSTPWLASTRMKSGSIGEMPPSTRGSPGASAAIACPAALQVSAKITQPGSASRSQWDLLFGSFQIIAASIIAGLPRARDRRRLSARRSTWRQMNTSSSGIASMLNPALRSMAAAQARFGAHQLVLSCE